MRGVPRNHDLKVSKLCTIKEQQEILDAELAVKWTQIKIKLSDWLLVSTSELSPSHDFKTIKCCVDAICGLNRLIGTAAQSPNEPADLPHATDRSQSLLKRLDQVSANNDKACKKSASSKKPPTSKH